MKAKGKPRGGLGFRTMPKEQHLAIARAGGVAVPAEKRMFARDPALAKRAGSMGGKAARRKK